MDLSRILALFFAPIFIALTLVFATFGTDLESLLASVIMSVFVVGALHLTLGRYSNRVIERTRDGPLNILQYYWVRTVAFAVSGVYFPLIILGLWPTDFDPLLAFTTAITVVSLEGFIHIKTSKKSQTNEHEFKHMETYEILSRNSEPYDVCQLTTALLKDRNEYDSVGSGSFLTETARETVENELDKLEEKDVVDSKFIMNTQIYYLKHE